MHTSKRVYNRERARVQFLTWMQNRHPEAFTAATSRDNDLDGMSAAATNPVDDVSPATQKKWYQEISSALPILAQTYREARMIKTNMRRADQGLPPIDNDAYATKVKVEHSASGLDPKMLGMAGVGLVALLIVPRLLKR